MALKVLLWSQVVDVIAPAAAAQPAAAHSSKRSSGSVVGSLFTAITGSSSRGSSSARPGALPAATSSSRADAADTANAEAAASLLKGVDVLLVDVLSDLPLMYSVAEVAFVGNSLLEGCGGHNLAEAAVAGCAVLVGEHAGHFNTMADELNQAAVSGVTHGEKENTSASLHINVPQMPSLITVIMVPVESGWWACTTLLMRASRS